MKIFNKQQALTLLNNSIYSHIPLIGFCRNDNLQVKLYADDGNYATVAEGEVTHVCFTSSDIEFASQVISQCSGEVKLHGLADELYTFVKDNYKTTIVTFCTMHVHDGTPYSAGKGFDIKPLQSKHWQLVANGVSYETTQSQIEEDIESRPTSAIYVNDEPVSWCLLHENYSLGMAFTKQNYRGKGYAQATVCSQCQHLLDLSLVPYSYVIKGHDDALNFTHKYNTKMVGNATFVNIILS